MRPSSTRAGRTTSPEIVRWTFFFVQTVLVHLDGQLGNELLHGHKHRCRRGLLVVGGDDGAQDLIADLIAVRQDLAHIGRRVIHADGTGAEEELDLVHTAIAGCGHAEYVAPEAGIEVGAPGSNAIVGGSGGPWQSNSSSTVIVTLSDAVWPIESFEIALKVRSPHGPFSGMTKVVP